MPMATLDEPIPAGDPDGLGLMASLRERLDKTRKPAVADRPLSDQYRPAMTAVQALLVKRRALGATVDEINDLEAVAAQLRSLARAT